MPVLVYIAAVLVTIFSSAAGLTALAVVAAVLASGLLFRHELRQLPWPTVSVRRTDP